MAEVDLHGHPVEIDAKMWLGQIYMDTIQKLGRNVAEVYLHGRPVEIEAKIWLKLSYMDTPRKLR